METLPLIMRSNPVANSNPYPDLSVDHEVDADLDDLNGDQLTDLVDFGSPEDEEPIETPGVGDGFFGCCFVAPSAVRDPSRDPLLVKPTEERERRGSKGRCRVRDLGLGT